jgi:hypothetical protein
MKIHRPDLVELVEPPQTAAAFWDTHCNDCAHDLHPMNVCSAVVGGDNNGPDYCPCAIDYPTLAAEYQRRSVSDVTTLRMRLGPFPNELDAVRSLHQRQDVGTPDDHVDVICRTCYILDEGWPCKVARLIQVLDAQISAEEVRRRALQA